MNVQAAVAALQDLYTQPYAADPSPSDTPTIIPALSAGEADSAAIGSAESAAVGAVSAEGADSAPLSTPSSPYLQHSGALCARMLRALASRIEVQVEMLAECMDAHAAASPASVPQPPGSGPTTAHGPSIGGSVTSTTTAALDASVAITTGQDATMLISSSRKPRVTKKTTATSAEGSSDAVILRKRKSTKASSSSASGSSPSLEVGGAEAAVVPHTGAELRAACTEECARLREAADAYERLPPGADLDQASRASCCDCVALGAPSGK